jgi:hypothetical protein
MKRRGDELRMVWERALVDVDVLITHGPPLIILDRNDYDQNVECEEFIE